MNGKEKCDFLRAFRKKIAEDNGLVLEQKDCTHEGDCLGTCPMCDAESSYLMNELRKKDVIHINADGKICMESGELKIDEFSRVMDQMETIQITDDEPRDYLGEITPGVIRCDDSRLTYDESTGDFVVDDSPVNTDIKNDGWD